MRLAFSPTPRAMVRMSGICDSVPRSASQASCSSVALRCARRSSMSPPSSTLPLARRPSSMDCETEPTPAMVATPSVRQARKM